MGTFNQTLLFLDAAMLLPVNLSGEVCLSAYSQAMHGNHKYLTTGANCRSRGSRASTESAGHL